MDTFFDRVIPPSKTLLSNMMDTFFDRLFTNTKTNETSLMRKFWSSQNLLDDNRNLFQNLPSELQQELLENSLFSTDFKCSTNAARYPMPSLFGIFNPISFHQHQKYPTPASEYPRVDFMKAYSRLICSENMMPLGCDNNKPDIHTLINLCEPIIIPTMKLPCDTKIQGQNESFTDLFVPTANPSLPTGKENKNVRTEKKDKNPTVISKKMDCNLNQQLVNRKTKELQKRSKRRRRRQKKCNLNSTASNVTIPKGACKTDSTSFKVSSSSLPDCKKNCDILCDVTVSSGSQSVQIIVPNLSSFVVTVESDSDWDTNSDADWVDDTEFQVCGLFVANFTNSCVSSPSTPKSEIPIDEETGRILAHLKKVNKEWKKSTDCLERKEKSVPLVSFAPDDELVETFPVEIYERKGEWEMYATERLRFKKRIQEIEVILSPCLSADHRAKIYYNLQQTVL